jgi:hypothetical protein
MLVAELVEYQDFGVQRLSWRSCDRRYDEMKRHLSNATRRNDIFRSIDHYHMLMISTPFGSRSLAPDGRMPYFDVLVACSLAVICIPGFSPILAKPHAKAKGWIAGRNISVFFGISFFA